MRHRMSVPATCLLLVVALAAPAQAHHGGIHPTFRTEQAYFHCSGPTKVYQVNWFAALADESVYMPWSTTPPAGSVTTGAGCGGADAGGVTNPLYDPVFRGTFTGNLRDVTIQLHHLLLSRRRTGPMDVKVYMDIDGIPLFPEGPTGGGLVTVTPTTSSTGASELFEFTVTNIGFAGEVLDASGNVIDIKTGGAALEDGDGSREHTLTVYVGLAAYPEPGAWVWDTTEVPSGIVFNPPTPSAAKIKATLPRYSR